MRFEKTGGASRAKRKAVRMPAVASILESPLPVHHGKWEQQQPTLTSLPLSYAAVLLVFQDPHWQGGHCRAQERNVYSRDNALCILRLESASFRV